MTSGLDDVIVDELIDLGTQEAAINRNLSRVRRRRAEIAIEAIGKDPGRRPVTDHAVVRFLGRVSGFDIEAVKAEIRDYVEACVPTDTPGILEHPSGRRLVLNEVGVVVTVLPTEAESNPPFEPGSDSKRKISCPYCARKFEHADYLRQHVRGRHSEKLHEQAKEMRGAN